MGFNSAFKGLNAVKTSSELVLLFAWEDG